MTIVAATIAFTVGTLALGAVVLGWWLGRAPTPTGRHRADRTTPPAPPAPAWADPEPRATYTETRPVDDSETTVHIPVADLFDTTVPLHTVTRAVR